MRHVIEVRGVRWNSTPLTDDVIYHWHGRLHCRVRGCPMFTFHM